MRQQGLALCLKLTIVNSIKLVFDPAVLAELENGAGRDRTFTTAVKTLARTSHFKLLCATKMPSRRLGRIPTKEKLSNKLP